MRKLRFIALAAVLAVGCGSSMADPEDAGGTPTDTGAVEGPSTTYFIVRHTERNPGSDPPINPEGEIRAEALADRLDDEGIEEIVTTQFIRGQQSGAPLAERLSLEIEVAPFMMEGSWPAFATSVGQWQRAREIAGRTYLMIGHSGGYNTRLIEELGADVPGTLAERYEDLVILVRAADGSVAVTQELYGGESTLDP